MMLMPASSEFAALCQSQVSMMAGLTGAKQTAVYLAERWSEQAVPKLIPIAVYPPDMQTASSEAFDKALPGTSNQTGAMAEPLITDRNLDLEDRYLEDRYLDSESQRFAESNEPSELQRLAVPLLHEGGVFGVLVGWRNDRPWLDQERDRMEECARSLTLACVLDQRGQWLKTQLASLDHVQTQQSDRFHELLHQLRSPLTALKTFGKLLSKKLGQDDQNQGLVTNMLREGDRMQELLGYFDDTLQAADASREEADKALPLLAPARDEPTSLPAPTRSEVSLAHFGGQLDIGPCWVSEIVEPLMDLTEVLAETAGMTLHVIAPLVEVCLQADRKAVTEILNNFIDNSLKYSSPGTHIWVQWGLTDSHQPQLTGILVGDTGPGIPKSDQDRIFERHFRGVQAAGTLDGTGLGLAIADDLVHEMAGHIELYSPLEELPYPLPFAIQDPKALAGTAFVIWLPQAVSLAA